MKERYIKIHDWMLSLDLTPTEVLVLGLINSFPVCNCSEEYMSQWLHCSKKSISRALINLEKKGIIEIEYDPSGQRKRMMRIGDKLSTNLRQNVHQSGTNCPAYNNKDNIYIKAYIKEKKKEKKESSEDVTMPSYLTDPNYLKFISHYGKS